MAMASVSEGLTPEAGASFAEGEACLHAGRLAEAVQLFDHLIRFFPRHLPSRAAKAIALSGLGRHAEALSVLRKAIHLAPGDPQLLMNAAVVSERTGNAVSALEYYDRALALDPLFLPARANRGALLQQMGRYVPALENNRLLVNTHPDLDWAHYNLADTLLSLEDFGAALAECEAALRLNPAYARAWIAKGIVLSCVGEFAAAEEAFANATHFDSEADAERRRKAGLPVFAGFDEPPSPRLVFFNRMYQSRVRCDWRSWDAAVACLKETVQNPQWLQEIAHPSMAFPLFSYPISAVEARRVADAIGAKLASRLEVRPRAVEAFRTRRHSRIRVGYISPDFRRHALGFLMRHSFACHDRERFEVYGYSLHPGDGSDVRRDIEQGFDVFRDLSQASLEQCLQAIQADEIDILADLAGYTTHARVEVFAARAAPVQVHCLGFPGTVGGGFLDYFITDAISTPPGGEEGFSEKLVYLPRTYFTYNHRQLMAENAGQRRDLGLPEQAFVFSAVCNTYKIDPGIFAVWMRLLKQTPDSVLWLAEGDGFVRQNLSAEAERHGVSASRLVFAPFAPQEIHLARYRLADLYLDTRYPNGHTTVADALWAGLPAITVLGDTFVGRVAASLLDSVGLPELAADNLDAYEALALRLAANPSELQAVRQRLQENRSTAPLFDTGGHIRCLEKAYEEMWRRYQAGLPPASFRVAS